MRTTGVVFERHLIHSGSYAGDSPMPGVVHRGIPLPKEGDPRDINGALGFQPIEDVEVERCYKYSFFASAAWYFNMPDSFIEVSADAANRFVMECNPNYRPELFVVGNNGAVADYYLSVMGEKQ